MKSSEMTDEQLRIRVAELRGWTRLRAADVVSECNCCAETVHRGVLGLPPALKDGVEKAEEEGFGDYPPGTPYPCDWETPNWPADLDACHEMEESSSIFESWRDTERWLDALETAVLGRRAESRPDLSFVFRATARQRCEAFVEVMG